VIGLSDRARCLLHDVIKPELGVPQDGASLGREGLHDLLFLVSLLPGPYVDTAPSGLNRHDPYTAEQNHYPKDNQEKVKGGEEGKLVKVDETINDR
jgi:hypothetical protein